MRRSRGFGSTTNNSIALFRLAFAAAPELYSLTLLFMVTRRSVLQKVHSHTVVLEFIVSIWFQVLFHSPPGVLFTFPSRYCFTIGRQGVFSLGGWSPLLHTGFHVSCTTLDTPLLLPLSFTRLSRSLAGLPFPFN